MQSAAAGRPAYSPDFEAESSFPERHLDDDKTPSTDVGPDRYRPAAAKRQPRQVFEPSLPTLYARDWPGESQPLARDSHVSPTLKHSRGVWSLNPGPDNFSSCAGRQQHDPRPLSTNNSAFAGRMGLV